MQINAAEWIIAFAQQIRFRVRRPAHTVVVQVRKSDLDHLSRR
jgi:hypothetical protein